MSQVLKLAVAQSRTLSTTSETLEALSSVTHQAAKENIHLILFPEAYIGGYPRTCSFGSAVGGREPAGRDQFLEYFHNAVDLGDTPLGAGDAWVDRKLPVAKEKQYRGDGTREILEKIARETGVFVVTGVIEKAGGSLYCTVLYVCPKLGVLGKRRKVMPTGSERLIWAQGSPSTLRAITTTIAGVNLILAAAICWENYMPLLRYSLYSQNVNLYLAPTAGARDTWCPLMQTIGFESRAFVLSANQCMTRKNLPPWIRGKAPSALGENPATQSTNEIKGSEGSTADSHGTNGSSFLEKNLPAYGSTEKGLAQMLLQDPNAGVPNAEPEPTTSVSPDSHTYNSAKTSEDNQDSQDDEFVSRGGSCIISPMGQILAGPLWEVEDGGFLAVEVDFEDCERGRLDLDVAGSYSRNDAFRLVVEGLDINPPPS